MIRIFSSGQIFSSLIYRLLILFFWTKRNDINVNNKVSNFSDDYKNLEIDNLATYLPHNIVLMIMNTPIPISNTDDKIICKFNFTGHFSIKSTT